MFVRHMSIFNILNKICKLILAVMVVVGLSNLSAAVELNASAMKGESIFNQKCAPCHTIGGGKKVGPDLIIVTTISDKEWVKRFIREPDKMFAEGDQTAIKLRSEYKNISMPNLGLSDTDVDDVLAYIEAESAAGTTGTTGTTQAPAATKTPAFEAVFAISALMAALLVKRRH